MCKSMLRAYEHNMLIMVDGFIATTAFLAAYHMEPAVKKNALFCHLSGEKGHKRLLDYFRADPILSLNMRLGEGSGCALAYPIIKNAVAFLNDMSDFANASVANPTISP